MTRRKIGDRDACRYCGQDIEWHGRGHGWVDRGNNRGCVPFQKGDALIYPKTKHAPPLSADALAMQQLRRDEASERLIPGA